MAKSSAAKNVVEFKAGLYTATTQLTADLQVIHRRCENDQRGGLPEESIRRLCNASPDLECIIVRRKSDWSRRRTRPVPLAAFLPHLPCEEAISAEEVLDKIFWEYGSDEEVSRQLCDGRTKLTGQSDDWQLHIQLDEPVDGTEGDWSISLWLQSVEDSSLRHPATRECIEETWEDPSISLSASRANKSAITHNSSCRTMVDQLRTIQSLPTSPES